MEKICKNCNTDISKMDNEYIENNEVCPYCFGILNIPISESLLNSKLLDEILSDNIVKQVISSMSKKYPKIYLLILCWILSVIFAFFLIYFSTILNIK